MQSNSSIEQAGTLPAGPLRWLWKCGRLLALYFRLDFLFMTRDLKTFLMWVVSDSIINVASVSGIWLLSERFAGIGVWSRPQVIFLLGYASLTTGLLETLFGYNIAFISRRIGRGQLDHVLIQPQPLWLSFLTEGFVPLSGSVLALPGLAMVAYALHALRLSPGLSWYGLLLLNLLGSVALLLAFQWLWGSLAFWAHRAAEELSSSTMQLMAQLKTFPLDGLGPALAGGLLTLLPVGFVAWLPCRALLGLAINPAALWATPAAALLFALLAAAIFNKGLVHYGRTGSSRYGSLGHRS